MKKREKLNRETIDLSLKAMHLLLQGEKFDGGKPRYDLLPPEALEEVVRVYTFGARKYADHNWRLGIKFSRLFSAAMRHLWAFWKGQDVDPESGLPHLAHAAFNVLGLLQYSLEKQCEFDDRYSSKKETA